MPGNFKSCVIFPFEFEKALSARIQLEPFVCIYCYGISIKIILELTSGEGDKKFTYERVAYEDTITQENIRDGFMAQPFIEVMEGFYYNKTEREILVPVCALLLKTYVPDLLESFNINLDSYIIDVEYKVDSIGFNHSEIYNDTKHKNNIEANRSKENTIVYRHPNDNQKESTKNCKQILQNLYPKNKKL